MKLRYIESFDGLRGIAIVMLLIFHGSYGYLVGGIPRVDLFSIMSGFLITYILYAEYGETGNISFRDFYMGRALRLLPALVACLILANILWNVTPGMGESSDRTITNLASLFYFSNLVYEKYLGNVRHLWSLSVEEHFYFIWPTLCLSLLFLLKDKARITFLCVTIVLLEAFRLAAYMNVSRWHWGIFFIDPYGFTLCRIDCMLIGALIFFVVYRSKFNFGALTPSRYDNLWLSLLAILFVSSGLFISFRDSFWLSGGYILTNALCAGIVIITLRNPKHPVLTHPWIKWIGVRSYGIYLYHMPIFYVTELFRVEHSHLNFILVSLLRFGLSIAAAALSYTYIELPFLRYKSNRRKARKQASHVRFEPVMQNAAVVSLVKPNGSAHNGSTAKTNLPTDIPSFDQKRKQGFK